jgi:hypothetical protein
LRVTTETTDNPTPPVAVITLDNIDYHNAMKNGLTTYNFLVTVVVGRAAEREMQRKLDAYCQPTGAQSVKAAIESNRSLSGVIHDLIVVSANPTGNITINDQTYLAAEFTVTVFA